MVFVMLSVVMVIVRVVRIVTDRDFVLRCRFAYVRMIVFTPHVSVAKAVQTDAVYD